MKSQLFIIAVYAKISEAFHHGKHQQSICAFTILKGRYGIVQISRPGRYRRTRQLSQLASGKSNKSNMNDIPSSPTGHTYVEGEVYGDRFAEIEAMGGDPFFLVNANEEDVEYESEDRYENSPELSSFLTLGVLDSLGFVAKSESIAKEWKPTDGTGPKPMTVQEVNLDEWDGFAVEDAHFD